MIVETTEIWQPQPAPPVPEGCNPEHIFHGVHWHQRWELFQGVFTPGRNPVSWLCDQAGLPYDLRGKRVLDIGAWHGCFSFECERRGAEEVVALTLEHPDVNGFNRLKHALGSTRVRFVEQSIYTAERSQLGEFDVILFFGVLYHLRYPLLAIDKIRNLARGEVYAETHVIDNYCLVPTADGLQPCSLGQLNHLLAEIPIWRFYKNGDLMQDKSNWFGPNVKAVLDAFETAGFSVEVRSQWGDRAAFCASVKANLLDSLLQTYEGVVQDNRSFIGI